MPSVGLPELLVVLMILTLVFGGSRLPQIGESLGRAARSLKRGLSADDRIAVDDARPDSPKPPAPPTAPKRESSQQRDVADAEIIERKP